ncbi:MAG: DNA topoisomerase IB [Gemmatimonadota bacterium]|nr:DNA topoisomerase IB [Gemmatimonadota bacterium]
MTRKWIRRIGSKTRGFRYVDEAGVPVRDRRTIARIDALRVPPAWRDVHIAASAIAAIQAWGYDARGRRQYRYHVRAAEKGQLRKYYRVRAMGRELPRIRRSLRAASLGTLLERETVASIVVRLITEGLFRPGSEESTRENSTFGITTMRKAHVELHGDCLVFRYVAKGRKRLRQCVVNRELARAVARLLATPGSRLFRYHHPDGRWRDLSARDVNEFLRGDLGVRYSAKDFRTWGGTLRAAIVLAELGPPQSAADAKRRVAMAMRLVAADLGNTPTICRKSYVHPMVVARYVDDGESIAISGRGAARGPAGPSHTPEERGLLAFLDRHFPERRRKQRAPGERAGPAQNKAA